MPCTSNQERPLEEANLRLQSVELKPSRKALVIPVSIVIAWEHSMYAMSRSPTIIAYMLGFG